MTTADLAFTFTASRKASPLESVQFLPNSPFAAIQDARGDLRASRSGRVFDVLWRDAYGQYAGEDAASEAEDHREEFVDTCIYVGRFRFGAWIADWYAEYDYAYA